jgi:hypothetical protein
MMIRIRRNRKVALAGLAVSVLLVGAEKKIVINEGDEVYKATFDGTKAPEARMREWFLLSPYVGTPPNPDENFYMAIGVSRENGVEKIDKIFLAPWLELCRKPGCESRPVDSAWLANAEKNLDLGQKQVQRLDAMTLPAVLEPVRSYLLASLRFSLDVQQARFRYIKDGDVQPLRTLFAATCRSSEPGDASMFANLAAAPPTARPTASRYGWENRMIHCRVGEGSYPIASWQAFVRNYGLKETTVSTEYQ